MHIVSYTNYYPFGMAQVGRNWSSGGYRFGCNGKEKDDEIKGSGNSVDFGARMLDTRVARWMKLDALSSSYPSFSPYNYTLNNPIVNIDPDGNVVQGANEKGKALLTLTFKEVFSKRNNDGEIIEECNVFAVNADGKVVINETEWERWHGPPGARGEWDDLQDDVANRIKELVEDPNYVVRVWNVDNTMYENAKTLFRQDRLEGIDKQGAVQTQTFSEFWRSRNTRTVFKVEEIFAFSYCSKNPEKGIFGGWALINQYKLVNSNISSPLLEFPSGQTVKFNLIATTIHELLDHHYYFFKSGGVIDHYVDSEHANEFVEIPSPVHFYNITATILSPRVITTSNKHKVVEMRTGCDHAPKSTNCNERIER